MDCNNQEIRVKIVPVIDQAGIDDALIDAIAERVMARIPIITTALVGHSVRSTSMHDIRYTRGVGLQTQTLVSMVDQRGIVECSREVFHNLVTEAGFKYLSGDHGEATPPRA